MTNQYGGGWLATVLVWTVTVIAAVFWAVATVIAAVLGGLFVVIVWVAATIWEWVSTSLVYAIHDLFSLVRYLVTGYCGYGGCGHMEPYGFVPEAGCPVHDADTRLSRWAKKARKGHEKEARK